MRCGNCSSDNPADAGFCRNCGNALVDHRPSVEPPAAAVGETHARSPELPRGGRCPGCGSEVVSGTSFCRSCGTSLGGVSVVSDEEFTSPGRPPEPESETSGSGPARVIKAPAGQGPELHSCPKCNMDTPAGFMFCQSCGAQLPTLSGLVAPPEVQRITAERDASKDKRSKAVRSRVTVTAQAKAAVWGRLVSIQRDGTDGAIFHLSGDWIDVGAGKVDVSITNDPYLNFRHARLDWLSGKARVTPLDDLNGVMLRVAEPTSLVTGAVVLLGREILRVDLLTELEKNIVPLTHHGVMLFGSPDRIPWGWITQIQANGAPGDVRMLVKPEVVIGREEGDVVFADDDFLSRRHASLSFRDGTCRLTDLGSSNGTFVRIERPTELKHGDHLRMGDQMFRYESAKP